MKLHADVRDLLGKKVKNLRKEGNVPAAIYGPKRESKSIKVNEREFKKMFSKVGFNKFFDLEIEGEAKASRVIIKELQKHPLKDYIVSVNFLHIDEDKKISVEVPITFVGEAPAVKQNLGFLVHQLDNIKLYCLPKDLPGEIVIDLVSLENIGDAITVSDYKLPENVELDSDMDATTAIAYIAAPQKEEVEVVAPAEGEEGEEGAVATEGGDQAKAEEAKAEEKE